MPSLPWTVHAPLLRETPVPPSPFSICCLPPLHLPPTSLCRRRLPPFPTRQWSFSLSPIPVPAPKHHRASLYLFPTVSLRCPSPTPSACAAPRPRRRRQPTREPEDVDLTHASPSVRRDSGTYIYLNYLLLGASIYL